jgi:hypothetical protein
LFFLTVFAFSSTITKAASQIDVSPTSGEPASSVHVEGSEFAASTSVGIGLGAEAAVINEAVTITGSEYGHFEGFTFHPLIKPRSLRWTLTAGTATILV